jgi:nucleoprotein TPR
MFRSMCSSGTTRNQLQSSLGPESNTAQLQLTSQYNQLQSQFEAFRDETAKDTERLKEDAYQARSEAGRNAMSAAKEKASRESLEERLMNLQQTHQMAKKELEEFQRRHSSLQENLTKQEIASHSLSRDLLMAKSSEDRLRSDYTNKRQRDFWKRQRVTRWRDRI